MPRVKRILWEIAGWSFIALGIAGLFLPVLQGILFLLIGLTILSKEYRWARHWIVKLRRKFPEAHRKLHRFLGRHSKRIPRAKSTAAGD